MLQRAKRKLVTIVGSTTGQVGPGSYEVRKELNHKIGGSCTAAPFGALGTRDTLLFANDREHIGQGPAHYKVSSTFDKSEKIPGGKIAFENGPRLVRTVPYDNNPAPCSYSAPQDGKPQKKNAKSFLKNKEHLRRIGVTFVPAIDPPSIPSPGQDSGLKYRQYCSDEGHIEREETPDHDKTIGPAYYTPITDKQTEVIAPTAPAVAWSKRTKRRLLEQNRQFRIDPENPSPDHYRYDRLDKTKYAGVESVSTKNSFGKDMRFKEPAKGPSPNAYQLTRFGDRISNKVPAASFSSKTERFIIRNNQVPPSTSYFPQNEFVKQKSDRQSYRQKGERSPFLSSAMRFPGKHIQERNAHISPVTYHLSNQSLAEESVRKAAHKQTLKGGFGTNCERKVKLLKSKSVAELPGPASYENNLKERKKGASNFGNSVFISRSHRVNQISKDKMVQPSPLDYSVENYCIQKDIVHVMGRNMNRAFSSSVDRTKAEDIAMKIVPVSPGPAAYKPGRVDENYQRVEMKTISLGGRTDRFAVKSNGVPTPTTYNLDESVMNTLQRRTYNKTLGATFNRRDPKATQNQQLNICLVPVENKNA